MEVKFSLKLKLILITSFIILASLSFVIFYATREFTADNVARIQEANLLIATNIASNVFSKLVATTEKMTLFGTTLEQKFKTPQQKELFIRLFFEQDKDFIYYTILNNKFNPIKKVGSKEFLIENNLTDKNFIDTLLSIKGEVKKVFEERAPLIYNVSPYLEQPIILIGIPFKIVKDKVIESSFAFLKMVTILKPFEDAGATIPFLVDYKGNVILHPNREIVLGKANFANLPIVKRMATSLINNGQMEFISPIDHKAYLGAFRKVGFGNIGVVAIIPKDKAFEAARRVRYRSFLVTVIILTIAIVGVLFFAKKITDPIKILVDATHEIKEGNYDIDIKPQTRDEIGILTTAFKEMAVGLKEREKMKEAFGKFVNKEIAEMVLKGELKLGGERKNVAVFFSDIRNFTAISEKLEPEEVVDFLNEYFTLMVDCVEKTNGVVDKFIGDAIMAVWGAPLSFGNDIENAINAALEMRKVLIEFNKGRGDDPKKPIIRIGCGINYGPAVAGQIGSEKRLEYTVIGDTVNLASRIEALNKPFGTDILISEAAYEQVKDIYIVEEMPPIKVKGKEKPQNVYAVLGRKDDPNAIKSLEELRKLLGIEMKGKPKEAPEEEVKYQIIGEEKEPKKEEIKETETKQKTNNKKDEKEVPPPKKSKEEVEEVTTDEIASYEEEGIKYEIIKG